jgi:hypothetical protein
MTKLRSAQMRTAVRITPTTGYSAWRFYSDPWAELVPSHGSNLPAQAIRVTSSREPREIHASA